jgi:hypothetical protein
MRRLVPPFPRPGPGHCSFRFPVVIGTTGSYASSAPFTPRLRSPSTICYPCHHLWWRELQRAFPSSWEVLLKTCPGLGTPVAPDALAVTVIQMLPSALLTASASTTKQISELNPRGPFPRCLRFVNTGRPMPTQDSLPACPLRL